MRPRPEAPLRIYGRPSSPNRVGQSYVAVAFSLVLGIEIGVLADRLGVQAPEIGRQIARIIVQSTPSVSAAEVIEDNLPVIRISRKHGYSSISGNGIQTSADSRRAAVRP